jgi:hypothetical protein
MQKVQVVPSTQQGSFRLIVNPNDTLSVGVVMGRAELSELFFMIKDLLEQPDNLTSAVETEAPQLT